MRRVVAICACLTLTSCALLAEGGASLAAEGALVETAGTASRLLVAPEAAAAAEGSFGSAMEGLAAGRQVLLVDGSGIIRAGSRGVASLEGQTLFVESRPIGELRDGYLYETGSARAAGRLRGSIPARDVQLEFTDGTFAPSLRPMVVDVLRLENQRYLIRLASGSQAWIPASALLGLALMGANEAGACDPGRGDGVLLRPSGEPVSFIRCEQQDDVLMLETDDGEIAVAADQAQEVIYGRVEVQFANALLAAHGTG